MSRGWGPRPPPLAPTPGGFWDPYEDISRAGALAVQHAARQGSLGSPPVLEAPWGPRACGKCLLDSLFQGHLCLHELLTSKE